MTFTAQNESAAMSALTALAAAGFYGRSNNRDLAMKTVGTFPTSSIKSVKVSGIHNCCEQCCAAIKEAINTVKGVTGNTAKPRATTFAVIGDFEAASLVKSLNAASFNARVEQ